MKNTIYALYIDNYYSRKFQIEYNSPGINVVNLYLEHVAYQEVSINFNPNDGISTTIVLNCQEWQVGNYAIVVNENNELLSRWFIMEAVRIREGQYRINLRRDVVMDYWDRIKRAPALIEKADLSYDDPLIYNNENFIVNQIKTSEKLLKDRSGCPWLVAYIAKDVGSEVSGTANIGMNLESSAISINDSIDNWLADYSTFYGDYKDVNYRIYAKKVDGYDDEGYQQVNAYSGEGKHVYAKTNTNNRNTSLRLSNASGWAWTDPAEKALKKGLKEVGAESLLETLPAYTPDRHTAAATEEFLSLNGKTIVDTNGKYFRVSISEKKTEKKVYNITSGVLYNQLADVIDKATFSVLGKSYKLYSGIPNQYSFTIEVSYNTYKTVLTPLNNLTVTFSFALNRVVTEDAPYDIIAIPYGTILAEVIDTDISTKAEIGIGVIQAIAKNLDTACYDIQLLPYCPIQDYIVDDGVVNTVSDNDLVSYIMKDEFKVGVIYHVPKANFSFDIFESVKNANTAIERKINNDCDKWRLSSPNYANYFDFSIEKNNGVQHFCVDCCYKPYNPYIHVNPNFNGLYGQDFNDPRGLVCGGDFSLTQVKSAWESYELQNKNYQRTFDRQIQNMEFNNKYQSIQDQVQAVTGVLSGAVSGAATGLMVGGTKGAIAGGAVGGVASTAGGIADVLINQRLRNEAIDYTIDQFGYSLGNIRAIPLTLSKISAFNANNKVFPILEYYTCTDREKEAYANKIAYNGMTVMAIGKIEDYITEPWEYTINESVIESKMYIKAKLIHLNMFEDNHIANEIASEINKGIFIEVGVV